MRNLSLLKHLEQSFQELINGYFESIVQKLVAGEKLPPETRDHRLKGTLKDCRECHIEPDWLLIYRIEGSELCLIRTGSHADLFE